MYNGLGMNIGTLSRLSNAKSRSISAENKDGSVGGGAREDPSAGLTTGANAARELGVGWKVSPSIILPVNTEITIADIEGPGAVQSMWFAGYVRHNLIFRIYWDGQKNPSVETPLPAFFAHIYCECNNYSTGEYPTMSSSMCMVAPRDGLSCYWEMPFKKHCRVTVENLSDGPQLFYYQINYTLTGVPENCAYFHAQYRQRIPIGLLEEYTVLDGIEGKGQYVGTSLAVGTNSHGGWWGEGEVKFYIDGDTEYPTVCGTGLDNYFLGAHNWESGGKYITYSGHNAGMFQVIKNGKDMFKSQQRFQMYRWHIPDPVRFDRTLKVTLQDLGRRRDGTYFSRLDDFMTVAYWYQTLPTAPFPDFPGVDELEIQ